MGTATFGLSVCYDVRFPELYRLLALRVEPWGTVLAQCPDRDGFALATLDLGYLGRLREDFPALKNRRPEAYDWHLHEG